MLSGIKTMGLLNFFPLSESVSVVWPVPRVSAYIKFR